MGHAYHCSAPSARGESRLALGRGKKIPQAESNLSSNRMRGWLTSLTSVKYQSIPDCLNGGISVTFKERGRSSMRNRCEAAVSSLQLLAQRCTPSTSTCPCLNSNRFIWSSSAVSWLCIQQELEAPRRLWLLPLQRIHQQRQLPSCFLTLRKVWSEKN